MTWMMVNK